MASISSSSSSSYGSSSIQLPGSSPYWASLPDPNYPFPIDTLLEHRKPVDDLEHIRRTVRTPGKNVAAVVDAANAITARIEFLKSTLWSGWRNMVDAAMGVLEARAQCPICHQQPLKPSGSTNHEEDAEWLSLALKFGQVVGRVKEDTLRTMNQVGLDCVSSVFGETERGLVEKMRRDCAEAVAAALMCKTDNGGENDGAKDDRMEEEYKEDDHGTKDVKMREDYKKDYGTEDVRMEENYKEDDDKVRGVSSFMSRLRSLIGMGPVSSN